jgi:acetoin utilization deacetylase AcuC-like enzyme
MDKIPTFYSKDFLTDYPTVDCECPDRVEKIYSHIKNIADFIEPEPCAESDLMLCHSEQLINTVKKNPTTYQVACKAAGGAIAAAELALRKPSFALIRPPGHHAGYGFNGGFCFFNNIAIAIKGLISKGLIGNALIVDIDLHYGNGTQDIVREDDNITFANIDSSSREDFFHDIEAAIKNAPSFDMLCCSAGFDTYIRDWGGLLFTDDYRKTAYMLASSNPHFFTILEGGYYIPDLGINVHAYLKGVLESCS